ncbi:MAG: SIS domain-containing protein [Rhodobacteraceae bacterium]|nr:SIS domain-containing protein [Paracoccaceae bacterium]
MQVDISAQTDPGQRPGFAARITAALDRLTPAEARMAQFFLSQRSTVLLGSAAQIGQAAGASDATVVRTARTLGYESLAALREDILADLTGAPSPGRLLTRTLDETGGDPARVLNHVAELQESAVAALRDPAMAAAFGRALDLLAAGTVRHVFGIGPSGALASYAALQMNRVGLRSQAVTASGVGLADPLMAFAPGDVVLMLAYAPLYREVSQTLERAEAVGAPVVLISDSLGPLVADSVAEVLPMPRGRAEHLATHSGTMALIEALILGLAARDRDEAVDALDRLSTLRSQIDRDWLKRGTRKPREGR